MAKKKNTTKDALEDFNKKNLEKQVTLSAKNAEKAYSILDEIELGEKTLYDIVFSDNGTEALNDLTDEQMQEYFNLVQESEDAKTEKAKMKIGMTIASKFPQLLNKGKDRDFEITKALRKNGKKAIELAKLFTGRDIDDFMEVVEQSKLYISFLGGM